MTQPLCNKPKDSSAVCVNCNLNHPANYRGCATYKEIQKLRGKQYKKLIKYTNKQRVITSPHPPIPLPLSHKSKTLNRDNKEHILAK